MPNKSLDYGFNSKYIAGYVKFKHGLNSKVQGVIYIENEKDKAFWSTYLGEEIVSRYTFSMASGPDCEETPIRGKCRFEPYLSGASKEVVFAIDADFDFLTPDRNDKCKKICESPYIIHTYGYSKESFTNSYNVIDACLEQYHYFNAHEYRIKDFIENYSKRIYSCVVKYLFLLNIDQVPLNDSEFYNIIIYADCYSLYFKDEWDSFDNELNALNNKFSNVLVALGASTNEFETKLNECGLIETTVYQYISGHKLEDQIIKPIINSIKSALIKEGRESYINSGARGKEISNRQQELVNHFKDNVNFHTLKCSSEAWLDNHLYAISKAQSQALV
ncbi:DUF4435 domain-containing protein [Psychromonas arctica]|uniref:DUF4435 domain-containing protein n=1 Tax=Psychromonas arctica TaxID=168275 RepID=UPI002FD0DE9D